MATCWRAARSPSPGSRTTVPARGSRLRPRQRAWRPRPRSASTPRLAASAVGATHHGQARMGRDQPRTRPRPTACLTNNKNRGIKPNAGGDLTPVGGPNPREANKYGQIVRWAPDGGDHAADTFAWDLYVIAGNPTVHADARAGSANVNADNMFNSPDGLALRQPGPPLDPDRRQVLQRGRLRRPGQQHDAARRPRHRRDSPLPRGPPGNARSPALPGAPIARPCSSASSTPGEKGDSHFPEGGDAAPRSSVVAITRDDGGVIG